MYSSSDRFTTRGITVLVVLVIVAGSSILLAQGSIVDWRASVKPGPKQVPFLRGEAPVPPTMP